MNNILDNIIELLNYMTDDEIVEAFSYKSKVNKDDDIVDIDGMFYVVTREEK